MIPNRVLDKHDHQIHAILTGLGEFSDTWTLFLSPETVAATNHLSQLVLPGPPVERVE